MAYGMKYTKGGFPFKAGPEVKKFDVDNLAEENKTSNKTTKNTSTPREGDMKKFSDLEKYDDDRPMPSFPATPEGSKQRAAAERALEAKEDAMGL